MQIATKKNKLKLLCLKQRCKLAFGLIKDRDYDDTYRNTVNFLFKSRIPVRKIYIFSLPWKIWNTEQGADFDRNPEIPL